MSRADVRGSVNGKPAQVLLSFSLEGNTMFDPIIPDGSNASLETIGDRGNFGSLIARGIDGLIQNHKHTMRDITYQFPPVALIRRRVTPLDILLEQIQFQVLDVEHHIGGRVTCPKCGVIAGSGGWHSNAVQSKGTSSRPLVLTATKKRVCNNKACETKSFHDDNLEVIKKQLPQGIACLLPVKSAKSGLPSTDVNRLLSNVEAGFTFKGSERATTQDVNTAEAQRRLGHLSRQVKDRESRVALGLDPHPATPYRSIQGMNTVNAQYLQQEYLAAVENFMFQNLVIQQSLPCNIIRLDHSFKVSSISLLWFLVDLCPK